MTLNLKKSVLLLFVTLLCTALSQAPAWALDLQAAKAQGLVGERPNGYLGAVSSTPSVEVTALVTEINQKRKAEYNRIATKNKTALSAVEALAAQKAINKTPAGYYIQLPTGAWKKK